jgi:uncharacterized membrane protein
MSKLKKVKQCFESVCKEPEKHIVFIAVSVTVIMVGIILIAIGITMH